MSIPTVSIVVSSYGRFEHIKKLVESARFCLPEPPLSEIVVVSSDHPDTEKVRWLKQQPGVRVVTADIRVGPRLKSLYHYENIGIRHATNEWVFVVNDDMVLKPGFYEELAKVEQDYDVILVNTHIGDVGLGARIAEIGTITRPCQEPQPLYLYDAPIIRKQVYEKIGFLDENLDWFGKGFDLAMTLELTTKFRILRSSGLYVDHGIVAEGRTPPHYYKDFSYAASKWSQWCSEHPGYSFLWPW